MIESALLFRVDATMVAALPVQHVVETMRPLPCAPIAGTPGFVLGAAVVRGEPVPVVDIGLLLGTSGDRDSRTRWVTIRVGTRVVALAVPEVVGVRRLPSSAASAPAPLLNVAARGAASTLSVLDDDFLVVLESASLVSSDVWKAIEGQRRPLEGGAP
jgi:purine-binding chemotaxis protein CheW